MSEVIADRDRSDLARRVVDPGLLNAHGDAGEAAAHLGDQFEPRRAHDAHGKFDLLMRGHLTRHSASAVTRGITSAESRDRVLNGFGLIEGFGHSSPRRHPYGPVPFVVVRVEWFFKLRGGPLLAPGVRARFSRTFAEVFDMLRRGL